MKEQFENEIKEAKGLIMFAFVFQIAHTTFFLIRDGWHWVAECKEEIYLDRTFTLLILIAFFRMGRYILKSVEYLLNETDRNGK